ncbi:MULTISPECIES: hypothetical protein [unclassified Mesorhizobium]|uniref:hypothetical protein n=1 Tax=unclassified Mesorhizobium TaxID=325217 RepID=UPI00112A869D|nr:MULTISPECIES: hypothetical protein [unclassified Mesorhizobium]TPK43475.1 hypothetical protein FJ550_28595 [Mesorhizobium sp. B2-5-2]TPL16560.1 hypothetical protein FJ946_30100 [Mesorhizobium sp. B2-4-7]TPL38996.1 hypothetical protein FJ961_18015 [Mesorhizobium sp. B2-4-5]TPM70126.1 hypothetical protein FJ968_27075 [Mesorhizobium sp. B2-1-6]TPN75607.1 hypothetical protein FJ985_16320 [Mesorhizobium sp. B1-1-2]
MSETPAVPNDSFQPVRTLHPPIALQTASVTSRVVAARLGAATPTTATSFELSVISALIMAMRSNGLIILGISCEKQKIITGLILILAVFLSLEHGKIGVIE